MVVMNTAMAEPAIFDRIVDGNLVRDYDDGPGGPRSNRAKERAFRQGFVEEARRVLREWAHPFDEMNRVPSLTPRPLSKARCNPSREIAIARKLRLRVRERYAVYGAAYGPDCAGRKTYHQGYRLGHEAVAARLRGRHHALEYVVEPQRDLATADVGIFDPMLLGLWLKAVEEWAEGPMRPRAPMPPPRLLDVPGAMEYLVATGQIEALMERDGGSLKTDISEPSSLCETHSGTAMSLSPDESETAPNRRLRLTRADQIEMRPPDWLLRGMLERDTFALVFGDPGSGKSFLAIDWACRVATGTPYRGHSVQGGPVVYIAGEGQQGFGRRIRAWEEYHGVSLADTPLYVAPAVAIPDASQLTELMAAIESLGEPPAMVVLDTLARNFGGGDENSTQDMSKFVSACDTIRRQYHCTILVVHHTGHADKNRARGAIAMKAALDAEYRLSDNEAGRKLTATKMKDAERPVPLSLALVSVDLPGVEDDYGNPATSAAVEVIDAETSAIISEAKAVSRRGKWQRLGLEVAKRLVVAAGDDGQASVKDWHSECESAGMRKSTRYDVLAKLTERGDLVLDGETIVPT